jgi:hypothetical protein
VRNKSPLGQSRNFLLSGVYEMFMKTDFTKPFAAFLENYDADKKNAIWTAQSQKFRAFWTDRIMNGPEAELDDPEIDEIVRILDRHGKGNTKESEAVAKERRLVHATRLHQKSRASQAAYFAAHYVPKPPRPRAVNTCGHPDRPHKAKSDVSLVMTQCAPPSP